MGLSMIDFTILPAGIKIVIGLVVFSLSVIGVGIGLHIAGTRHFGILCSAFSNSQGVQEDLKYWSTISLRTRAMVVNRITLAVVWPSLGIRQGWLNSGDYLRCPTYLKRRLTLSFWCTSIGWAGIVVGGTLIRFGRL